MATIPTILARRSLDVAGAIQVPTGSPVGAALEQGGAKLASVANAMRERQERNDRFNALLGLDELKANLDGDFDKTLQENKSPDGSGIHDNYIGTLDKKSQEWIATQPESMRPELTSRLSAMRARESVRAAKAEAGINENFHVKGIEGRLEAAQNDLMKNPGNLDKWKRDIDELAEAGNISPDKKLAIKEKTKERLAIAAFYGAPTREKLDRAASWGLTKGGLDAAVDKIIGVESGGKADAKNPSSSATGAGQFIEETWIDVLGRNNPALVAGKSRGQVLAMRNDPVLSREVTKAYALENAEHLKRAGAPVTAGNVYLAHFLGPQGAAKALTSSPDTPISKIVGGDAVAANRSILAGKTVGEVAAWAEKKMGGEATRPALATADPRDKDIPMQTRIQLAGLAEREAREQEVSDARARTAELIGQRNQLQRQLQDGQAGHEEIQLAEQEGWLTDADEIQKFRNIIDQRNKGQEASIRFAQNIAPGNNYVWNPINKDDREAANAGFKNLGGDVAAVERIVEQTSIIPPDAALALRGALVSPNTQVVQGGLEMASKLMKSRPNIFAGVDGAQEIERQATMFTHLTDVRGFPVAKATEELIKREAPEYKQKVTARLRDEDVNQFVKKNIKDSDLRDAFDDSWFSGEPKLGFKPEMAKEALAQYEEAAREAFLETGDSDLAKSVALKEIKKTWGVSRINGDATIMKFPPEIAAAYRGVKPENFAKLYTDQLAAEVKFNTGDDLDRSTLKLTPTNQTIDQMARGEPPQYIVTYVNKDKGTIEKINQPFYADPDRMVNAQRAVLQGRYDETLKTKQENTAAAAVRAQEPQQQGGVVNTESLAAIADALANPRIDKGNRKPKAESRLLGAIRDYIASGDTTEAGVPPAFPPGAPPTRENIEASRRATVVPEADRRIEIERDATGRATKARVGTRRLNLLRDEKGRFTGLEEE